MVVKLKPGYDFGEYWNAKLHPQALYIVYAIEWSSQGFNYYIDMSVGGHTEYDFPYGYAIDKFEIVDGDVPDDWQMGYLKEYDAYIMSFPEWLNPDFAVKLHNFDIDLVDEYVDTVASYAKKYEAKYAELLAPNQELLKKNGENNDSTST